MATGFAISVSTYTQGDNNGVFLVPASSPPAPPDDTNEATITGITPTPGVMAGMTRAEQRRQPVTFDITDVDPGLATVVVMMKYTLETDTTVIHDGTNFVGLFDNDDTSRTAITDGYRFTILPSGGWRSDFTLSAVAVDLVGNVGNL